MTMIYLLRLLPLPQIANVQESDRVRAVAELLGVEVERRRQKALCHAQRLFFFWAQILQKSDRKPFATPSALEQILKIQCPSILPK
jgi:hypothetical protein